VTDTMKAVLTLLLLAWAAHANPVQKVLQLLGDLETKITAEGAAADKVYKEATEWCEERAANLGFEIKTGKGNVADLTAAIQKETSTIGVLTSKIEDLAGSIAKDEQDLAAATKIRETEAADFAAEDKENAEVIDTLERAIAIIKREMAGGASMLQFKNLNGLVEALQTLVETSEFSHADASRLTALVQSNSDSDDEETGAPDPEAYKSKSGGIVDTLEGLMTKAEEARAASQHKETEAVNAFELTKQSLEDSIKNGNSDLAAAKKGLAEANGAKAIAEGDLSVTQKALDEDLATKSTLAQDCQTQAEDYEAETASRAEELKALAAAKAAVADNTGGAEGTAYGFLQSAGLNDANLRAVTFVRNLARTQRSSSLAQLATRMASAVRVSNEMGGDAFDKVKDLIANMIERLENQAKEDATHKAWCDKEMSETTEKQTVKNAEIDKLSVEIDGMSARSAQLKEEVSTLQKELAELAASQAEMDDLRQKENKVFVQSKADTEQGLEGVKLALKILREYYSKSDKSHDSAGGAASGIIGMLEVVESDFSRGLAEMISAEDSAASTYHSQTKQNEISLATKEQDVNYKGQESTKLDKAVAESTADRESVQTELDAVNEYLGKLKEQCIAKAEPYAERARRRQEEIAGLKSALEILSGESALIQTRALRGVRLH